MTSQPTITLEEARARGYSEEAIAIAGAHACWRAGTLEYRFSDVQLRMRSLVYEHAARRIVWLTCRRLGKSRSACGISTEKSLAYPGVRIPYAASTGEQVRDFVDPHMVRIANEAPPDLAPEQLNGEWVFPPLQWFDAAGNPVRTKDEGGTQVVRYKGNAFEERLRMSRIVPKGCEDTRKADRLRGPGTIFIVIDEARDIDILEYVLSEVFAPMLWEARSVWGPLVRPKMLIPSTAPRTPDHPHNAVIDRAIEAGAYAEATVYDCDHLDAQDIKEAIEEAGGEDTVAFQREGLAKRVRDTNILVLPEFDDSCIGEHARPEHFLPGVIGDGGFIDMAVMAFGYFDFEQAMFIIEDEIAVRRTDSATLDALIAAKERELWSGLEVHTRKVDAPPQTRADMGRAEWQREKADGEESTSWTSVRKDEMEAGANAMRVLCKRGKVRVHPRCKTIVAHCTGARWNTARTEFVRVKDPVTKEPLHHYDGAAAAIYFVRDIDRLTNPFPAPAEHVLDRMRKKKREEASESHSVIRGMFRRGQR